MRYFFDQNQRYPSAREIDHFEYLPASRTIQRRFGGLEKLRTELGLPIPHYGKGESRSKSAVYTNKRGREWENRLYEMLREKFGEPFVHLERPFAGSKKRVDFYVFSPSGNFGADVFYPNDLYTMGSNLNLKIRLYRDFHEENYLVVANPNLAQQDIDAVVRNKIKLIPNKCSVVTVETFISRISPKTRYKAQV